MMTGDVRAFQRTGGIRPENVDSFVGPITFVAIRVGQLGDGDRKALLQSLALAWLGTGRFRRAVLRVVFPKLAPAMVDILRGHR